MSDDTRSIQTKARKRPIILVVNNPTEEGSSSDDERTGPSQVQSSTNDYHSRPLPSPSHSIPVDRSQGPSAPHLPPPLTTNVSEQMHYYPSSRSNPSNPALSSPSTASSPAVESTPPPSTPGHGGPGHSLPPVDLSEEGTIRQEAVVVSMPDRTDGLPSSASGTSRFLASFKSHLPRAGHGRRSSNNSKQPSSPTAFPSDSYTSHSNPVLSPNSNEKITLLVTGDTDNFSTVDISGAMTAAFIRERIFSKLRIPDEDQQDYSIYRTEIGRSAIGDALTDEQLFSLYREQGDGVGSLKLFVSRSSAQVHESSQDLTEGPPMVNTIPPPLLYPLQPTRRLGSRRGSQSSASERLPLEATSYDASVSDDLEPDRETRRKPPRPSQVRFPTSSQRAGSPASRRPRSPNHMSLQGGSESPTIRPDFQSRIAQIVPHSLSPQKSHYVESPSRANLSSLSPDSLSGDRFTSMSATRLDSPERSRRFAHERAALDKERRTDDQYHQDSKTRRRNQGISRESPEGWQLVSQDVPGSGYMKDRPQTPQETRSPNRYHGANKGYVPMLPHPPRTPVGSNETRPHKQRGQPVPVNWAITYKEVGRSEQKPQSPPGPSLSGRIFGGAKSMNNLRDAYRQQQAHPPSLMPGPQRSARQPQPPLPVTSRPSTSGSTVPSGLATQPASSSSEITSSYIDVGREVPPMSRGMTSPTAYPTPRPSAGPGHLGLSSSGRDPIPRPHSALDDRANSEFTQRSYLPRAPQRSQQPGFPPSQESPQFYNNDGTSSSQTTIKGNDVLRSLPRPERTYVEPDLSSISSGSSKPPRGPPSPGGPAVTQYESRDQESRSTGFESTMTRDQHAWWEGLIDENAIEGTLRASTFQPHHLQTDSYVPSNASSLIFVNPSRSQDEDESDSDDGLWAKKPDRAGDAIQSPVRNPAAEKSRNILRPPLPPLNTQGSPSKSAAQFPSHYDTSKTPPANFPGPPDFIPPPPPPHHSTRRPHAPSGSSQKSNVRTSRFENEYNYTWAPRPNPEDVLQRLEEYFPEHDVDRPVIEMSSGGTSPTSAENPIPVPSRAKHKKSIRGVAEEHKKRFGRAGEMGSPHLAQVALRKRNTKLWGSKLEEVTTGQARTELPLVPQDPSPGGTAKPIFRWVRGELIGKGTYGKVYLALNATTGEMIAVKQVEMPRTVSDKDDSRQVTVVEALKLESETLKDLDHPNIVQYLGFEETPTFLSIFLEYVPGGSIASCLRKHGKFDEEVTKSFTEQILAGLEYLHGKGILHRDLKADNILVEPTGVCKISDFGISKRTDDINMAGAYTSMQGTVFWMAPEVINSQQGGYNSKIDIWSVGCVVYEMWTGQRPWNGQEAMAVLLHLYQTKEGPPVPADVSLSPLADDFRQKCFAMEPDERPTAAVLRKHPYLELQPGWTFNGFK